MSGRMQPYKICRESIWKLRKKKAFSTEGTVSSERLYTQWLSVWGLRAD
jgi:hypothetical protein